MMRVAQLQTHVFPDKMENFRALEPVFSEAAPKADLVTLPEMFCCPYQAENFPVYAEPEGGEAWQACSDLARRYGVYLSAGSMPERGDGGQIYNTAYVFDRQGRQIAKHRKMHLFDIQVQGGQRFQESKTLTAGDAVTVFDTEFGTLGICICYDIRFPELSRLMVLAGAKVLLVPAAFNMTTGPAHWELSFRMRALDNQCYCLGTAPARDLTAGYHSWGHTIAAGPWGDVIAQMEDGPGWQLVKLDLERVTQVRQQLPLLLHRRTDRYELRERQ